MPDTTDDNTTTAAAHADRSTTFEIVVSDSSGEADAPFVATLAEIEAHVTDLDPDLMAALRALAIGGVYDVGGGASAIFTYRRLT